MEDSYTVHRRRKAAARKREKTPEPPKRRRDEITETDDDEDARARMERMVQETERLEALEENERRRVEKEKTTEKIVESKIHEDKPQHSLKRAMSPEIRPRDEENCDNVEKFNVKSFVQVGKGERSEKTDKARSVVTKKISSTVDDPDMENWPKECVEETSVSRGAVRRCRANVETDISPESSETSGRIGKKVSSLEIETFSKDHSDTETNRSGEFSRGVGVSISAKRISSRGEIDEVKRATRLDENRHEARDNDAGPVGSLSGKNEFVERQDLEKSDANENVKSFRTDETSSRTTRLAEGKVRKRDVTSPARTRNLETRNSTTHKRSSKERTLERTGYTTDSSETEEATKRVPRRKKSPEGAKLRGTSGKKIASRSRPTTDTDGDVDESERKRRNEKISTTRRRTSSETDDDASFDRTRSPSQREKRDLPRVSTRQTDKTRIKEKRSLSRSRYSSEMNDNDESKAMTKSETFPHDPIIRNDSSSSITRSMTEIKKQIIPLSDDSLIEDFERAQLNYMRKERGILDHDPMDDYVDPRMKAALRRRKCSIIQTETEDTEVAQRVQQTEKKCWYAWLPFFGRRATKVKINDEKEAKMKEEISLEKQKAEVSSERKKNDSEEKPKILTDQSPIVREKVSFLEFFRTLADFASEFRAFVEQNPRETRTIRILRNRCVAELILAIIYCGLGAFVFRFTEGAFETFYKCGVKRVKRDFLDNLWNFSHNMREDDWKSMARRKLMEFEEQLHTAHEAGVHSYSGQKSWSFLNAVVYCLTVITTIGYGHISPSTTTGRAITIVYAIFGIPMFLIILADFGKLFTRGIKFLWAFVRRVYYTGSCRRVRRTVPVQEVMKGVQLVYDLATFRRPSQMNPEEIEEMEKQQNQTQTVLNLDGNSQPSVQPDTPGTPALSTFAIDDEFNLPISVAIIILLVYIFVGATVYNFWEQWGFFESFYFVFISMSTIGFGDYVPKHPIYMMLSIVYLVFGLALTSMCINVVQVMLSDSFKQASQKIGATIGFEVTEEDGEVDPATLPMNDIVDVHTTIKESESEEQVAPKAKQEDVEL